LLNDHASSSVSWFGNSTVKPNCHCEEPAGRRGNPGGDCDSTEFGRGYRFTGVIRWSAAAIKADWGMSAQAPIAAPGEVHVTYYPIRLASGLAAGAAIILSMCP
jgi:hypothetical protein